MHDKKQPLPNHEEVLICTPETTTEEVSTREMFCFLSWSHVQQLQNLVAQEADT